jgi:hypothetical protein
MNAADSSGSHLGSVGGWQLHVTAFVVPKTLVHMPHRGCSGEIKRGRHPRHQQQHPPAAPNELPPLDGYFSGIGPPGIRPQFYPTSLRFVLFSSGTSFLIAHRR